MTLMKEIFSVYKALFERHRLVLISFTACYFGIIGAYFSYQRTRAEKQNLEMQVELLKMRLAKPSYEYPQPLLLSSKALEFRDVQLSSLPTNQKALVTALNEFGKYSIRTADYDKAIEELNESLHLAPTSEALYYKGLALYGKRSFPLAAESWKQALNMDLPRETEKQVALDLALAYREKNDPSKATYYFDYSIGENSIP